jgi:outer membrane PBP1 activator LpoA protein
MQKLLFTLVLGMLLFGCAEKPTRPPSELPPDKPAQAQQALDSGDYYQAISLYTQLAEKSAPPERYGYQYQAAVAMFRAGLERQASQQLAEMPLQRLSPALRFKHQLLRAEIPLKHDPDLSLSLLLQPAVSEQQLPARTDLYARYHLLRARAFARLGNHLETAREYIQRELYLQEQAEIEANQLAIWQSLSLLTAEALQQLRVQPPPDALSGWMELVAIAKNYSLSPAQVQQHINTWHQRYPSHPAGEQVLELLLERSKELATRPGDIALLLPLSGRFAAAGESILDGIFAAYYQDPQRNDIRLHIYDVGDTPEQVMNRYWEALADGVEFVIGPLDKSAVEKLAQYESLPLPTLALNYAMPAANDNLYQFSLAPEDEARQVAERAWLEGYANAAVLVPDSALGQRLNSAFSERWQELGGLIVSESAYAASNSDFSAPIKTLLNISDSEFRKRRVQQLMRQRVEFTPRRRQDIDFIFLAAFPQQARLMRPQLKFHHAGDLPILATSHLYSGVVERDADRDMDDILFCDMPWTLDAPSPQQQLRAKPELRLHSGQLQRLVALGIDAYQLVPLVPMLESHPYERYRGETGSLQIDDSHRIVRQLLWARFERGRPVLMEERIMDDAHHEWQNAR